MPKSHKITPKYQLEAKIQNFLGRSPEKDAYPILTFLANFIAHLGDLFGYISMYIISNFLIKNGQVPPEITLEAYTILWVYFYYLGERTKLIFKMPRPHAYYNKNLVQSHGARFYNQYGPPSTHVIGINFCGYPILVWFYQQVNILDPNLAWFSEFILLVCGMIGLARIYIGAHTIFCVILASFICWFGSLFYFQFCNFFNYLHTSSSTSISADYYGFVNFISLYFTLYLMKNYPEIHLKFKPAALNYLTLQNEKYKFDSRHDLIRIALGVVCLQFKNLLHFQYVKIMSPGFNNFDVVAFILLISFACYQMHSFYVISKENLLVILVAVMIQNFTPVF